MQVSTVTVSFYAPAKLFNWDFVLNSSIFVIVLILLDDFFILNSSFHVKQLSYSVLLGIYSIHSNRSSLRLLAHISYFLIIETPQIATAGPWTVKGEVAGGV